MTKKMTKEFLWAAFSGESQARMKYTHFAKKAEKEGFDNVARLFRAIAYAEEVHAGNHLRLALKEVKETSKNLDVAKGGEDYEIDSMYPAYEVVAELEGEKTAQKTFNWAFEAEKIHSQMFGAAKEKVDAGSDIEIDMVYICPVCGHTHEGSEQPDQCPVCGFTGEYKEF